MDFRELTAEEKALINDTQNKYNYQNNKRKEKRNTKVKYKRIWFFQKFNFWLGFFIVLPIAITLSLLLFLNRMKDTLGDDVFNEVVKGGGDSSTTMILDKLGIEWVGQIAYLENNKINIILLTFLISLVIILMMIVGKIIQIKVKGSKEDG